jgi:hypothetical protein
LEGKQVNPFLIFLVLIGCFLFWLIASFLYKPIGKLFGRLVQDAADAMNDPDKTTTNEEEK